LTVAVGAAMCKSMLGETGTSRTHLRDHPCRPLADVFARRLDHPRASRWPICHIMKPNMWLRSVS
jgi:hypothetical protein